MPDALAPAVDDWGTFPDAPITAGTKHVTRTADGLEFEHIWGNAEILFFPAEFPALIALANDALWSGSPYRFTLDDVEACERGMEAAGRLGHEDTIEALQCLREKLKALLRPA